MLLQQGFLPARCAPGHKLRQTRDLAAQYPSCSTFCRLYDTHTPLQAQRHVERPLARSLVAAKASELQQLDGLSEETSRRPQRIKLRPLRGFINWYKWEGRWFERWQQQQQQQQLQGGQHEEQVPESSTQDAYFARFSNPTAHQLYLEDDVAMETYRRAILGNEELFRGKVVLDVGCGLGLTALMAAKAGAAHVYAVDASAVADQAAKVVAANGMQGRVTVLRGRVETIDLPLPKVDIIVSNFMGPFLLGGGMLPALLRARDRFLAPGGLMLPDRADLMLLGLDDREHQAAERKFWSSCHGFDLSCVLPATTKHARQGGLLRRAQALTPPARLVSLDLYEAAASQLAFSRPFRLTCAREEARVSGLMGYFDCAFTFRGRAQAPEVLRTGPGHEETHWQQTIFSFPRALKLSKGEVLVGKVACRPGGSSSSSRETSARDLLVDVEVELQGAAARQLYVVRDGML